MRIKYCIFSVLIGIFVFGGMILFTPKIFPQEGLPEPTPEELIKEMLTDPDIPEEIRKELEEMMRMGDFEDIEEESVEIPDVEYEYPPMIEEEEREEVELEELERPPARRPEAEVIAPAKANRISLDLKGVDIIDVLKMLSARSALNIVAGRNVRGRVTLFLKDVDVWDAFEIILAANNLAYIREGEIINVMTERDYEQLYGEKYYTKKILRIYKLEYTKASDVSKALNQAKSKIGKVIIDEGSNAVVLIDSPQAVSKMEKMIARLDVPIETRVFSLDYATAEDVKTKVSEILTTGIGTIQVDERTNKVIVTDFSKKMPEIENIIEEMDEKHKEVLIEAKIIEIELSDEYQYGIDWKAAFNNLQDQGFRISLDNVSGNVWTGTTGGTVTLASVASRNINGVIEALQNVGRTNVISSPRITVLNNEEAKVLVGTEQPYVTTTYVTGEVSETQHDEVTYIDVGVQLTVTPTINKDGYVTMKIKPEISSLGEAIETAHAEGATGNRVYPVSKSETETTVMVKDGHTILIAGLIQDRDIESEEKIPILGDIPILGWLFKNQEKGSTDLPEKKELVIFLTPYIIHGDETFPEAENVWYGDTITQRELLEQQMSMAVEDIKKKGVILQEMPPPKKVKDAATKISDDLEWFERRGRREKPKEVKLYEEERIPVREVVKPVERITRPVEGKVPEKEALILPPEVIIPSISEYYNYYANVRNRVYWFAKDTYPRDFEGEKEDVIIHFTLRNDGRLKGRPKVLNEVARELARAAKTAVAKAVPFPPFPERMDKDEEIFRITITYQ